MSCASGTAKTILVFVNVLFLLAGLALIATGAYVKTGHVAQIDDLHFNSTTIDDHDQAEIKKWVEFAPLTLICFGVFVTVLAFFGCCGAAKESRCLLGFFLAVVLLLFISQVAVGGVAVANRGKLDGWATKIVNATYTEEASFYQELCGDVCNTNSAECVSCVEGKLSHNLKLAGAILLGIAALEFIVLLSACCLLSVMGNKKNDALLYADAYNANRNYYAA
eukprot:CAMPEP_0114552680 /NCGR_PEP_ID=MMETSP0114-20121206/7251_1 /TAXON_ID=31324 /ORGANISM="Goniomonas sp, Strain m" /LENGTH=221 /DNA_ID=CAMNT_0001737567 /DNA_START=45 /DNA_END=710 /DNA_ORIENTATION=-